MLMSLLNPRPHPKPVWMHGICILAVLVLFFKDHLCDDSKKVEKFPDIAYFLGTKHPDLSKVYKISDCEVKILSGSCAFRVIPQRAHCLTLAKVVRSVLPSYIITLSSKQIRDILPISISVFYINTCLAKVTFVTSADGELRILPELKIESVVADLSVPFPFGDYELTARGVWKFLDEDLTIKVTRSISREMTLSGSLHEGLPIKTIGNKFDVDILPTGGLRVLLENIGLGSFKLHRVKVRGKIDAVAGNYDIVFSGMPDIKTFEESHVRVFVVKRGAYKNLAILLELPDFSPVTLLKKMFGPTINKITLLRDRNQTLALFVTSRNFSNFTQVLTAHGSSRWIHRDSEFMEGATLLVTLPFPKRKALDMKIQIFPDGLAFSLPDGENLPADLALTAISPMRVTRVDRKDYRLYDNLNSEERTRKFHQIQILRFRYFIFNDTYVAAAEQLNAMEEELKEMMPEPIVSKADTLSDFMAEESHSEGSKNALDMFFKRSERLSEADQSEVKVGEDKNSELSVKSPNLINRLGLLRRRRFDAKYVYH